MSLEAYNQLSSTDNKMFVIVAGNIGSGKTTLTKKLSEKLGWKPHFESVQDNPYLADFYDNMSRWSFPLQVYFLNHRFNTHKIIENAPGHSARKALLSKDAANFKAEIKISSEAGIFEASAAGTKAEEVLDQVSASINHQLIDWKLNRHNLT